MQEHNEATKRSSVAFGIMRLEAIFMRHEFLESPYAWLADYFSDYYELADLLNCSTRTVNRIMSGQRKLTRREQVKILEYLGLNDKSSLFFTI